MRHVDQESATGLVEKPPQKFCFTHLRVSDGKEARDVFHHQWSVDRVSQYQRVLAKPPQKFLRVQRREDVIKRSRVVLSVQALKMLSHPGTFVSFLKLTSAFERELAERVRELSQVIV